MIFLKRSTVEDFAIEFYPERNINGPFFFFFFKIYTGRESSCQEHRFGATLERKCMFFAIFISLRYVPL